MAKAKDKDNSTPDNVLADTDELEDDALELEDDGNGGKDADNKSGGKPDKSGKSDKSDKKKGSGKKFIKFFRDCKGELSKVIWPTRKTVVRNTTVTIAMCAIVGAAVSLFDYGLSSLIRLFTK